MKNARVMQWVGALRSGGFRQTRGRLHTIRKKDSTVEHEFCCLGVGAKTAGIPMGQERPVEAFSSEYEGSFVAFKSRYRNGEDEMIPLNKYGLPPIEFARWLGLPGATSGTGKTEATLYLDAPIVVKGWQGWSEHLGTIPLHKINDEWKFTFDQIADCIAYFGVSITKVYND